MKRLDCSRLAGLAFPVALGFALVACDAHDDPATSTSTPSRALQPSAQAPMEPAAATSPSPTNLPPTVEQVIRLVGARDAEALALMSISSTRPCAAPPEGSPQCEGTDSAGTHYRVFPTASCQGHWTRNIGTVMALVVNMAARPYAVARQGPTPAWAADSGTPWGEYLVIFEPPAEADQSDAVALYVSADGIVRAQTGCRRTDQFLAPGTGDPAPTIIWRKQ